jgi:UDP-N-acetylmuramoylalanine--D-glutamate ligase
MRAAVNAELIGSSETPVIVGLGVTGLSCARYFQRLGQPFTVIDSRENPPGLSELRQQCPQARVQLGTFNSDDLRGASRLVVSPGIALTEPALVDAMEAGVRVCGDIDLFCAEARAPVVGITGSNAKSTVTQLLGNMAARAGVRVAVGGNLGTPALDLLDDEVELYIVELSSFQLERAGNLGLEVAVVLNLSDDHMDRHGNMPEYHRAKHRVFLDCKKVVFNREDPLSRPIQTDQLPHWSFGLQGQDLHGFGLLQQGGEEFLARGFTALMPCSDMAMLGRHNIANALAALALGAAVDLPMEAMLAELREYTGLPHRCQVVAEIDGVSFVNDSKATNCGAALAALRGLSSGANIVLIAGGQGKGADFTQLADEIARCCRAVVLLGEDAPLLEEAIRGRVAVHNSDSMSAAVSVAREQACAGDVVLLSPACASFDMFTGFAARGQAFMDAVLEHAACVNGEAQS